jgi:uncharacterized protein with HEPN domain
MKDDTAYLVHIVEHARMLSERLKTLDRATFDADPLIKQGTAHILQIIGEAARLISEEGRARFPLVPWTIIVGMRHRIVHEYFRTDFSIVWDTANVSVPELLAALEPEIGPIIDRHQS